MVEFIKYHKIRRLGAVENEGILDKGTVYIFEKLDGANTQIRMEIIDGKKQLLLGSRNRFITEEDGQFAAFYDWAHNHEPLQNLPVGIILFGEFALPHTIKYNDDFYNKFYLFDVYSIEGDGYLGYEEVERVAKEYDLELVKPWFVGTPDELADYMQFVGKSDYGPKGEGIIIKNYGFLNRFGRQAYAKVVSEEFKEVFDNKYQIERKEKSSNEREVLATLVTEARVRKILEKGKNGEIDLGGFEYAGDMRDMRWLPKAVYDDIIDEEAHYICRNFARVDFVNMRRMCPGFVAPILKSII